MKFKSLWFGPLMLVVFTGVADVRAAEAQEATTGTIEGQVVDGQGLPIPGATVIVTGAQGAKTFVTDSEGRFLAPFLTPGPHKVQVELSGFRPVTVEQVNVPLGQRATLAPITLRLGGLTESVEVIGSPATVDTSTASTGASLQSDFLERLPTQRHVSDVVHLAPGVSDSGGAGDANPSIAGASGLENQYIIDGVNVTNSGYGAIGSYSIVFGSLGRACHSTSSKKCA